MVLIFLGFLVLLLAPFIPGIAEFLKPHDASPLFINMNYTKDPRYFGKSFKNIIYNALGGEVPETGKKEIKLSKNETLEVTDNKKIFAGEETQHVYYVKGDFVTSHKAQFTKEIYVTGDAAIGTENTLRALACEGKVFIAEKVNVIRWVDAEGSIDICRDGVLGINISTEGTLRISRNCKFKRLFGLPIVTVDDITIVSFHDPLRKGSEGLPGDTENPEETIEISDKAWLVHEKYSVIPESTTINQDFITRKDLRIKNNCTFSGNIRTYGGLIIGEDVNVAGNVFAEGDVEIGSGSVILGSVFTQGSVRIRQRARIGNTEEYKSVIGKKGIIIHQDVKVFGYIMTEGPGLIA
jgi:predicted acyltransferase (DUF342 family)